VIEMSFAIETDRLLLRDLKEEDLPVLIGHFTDPKARDNILSNQSSEDFVRWYVGLARLVSRQPQRNAYVLAVVLKSENVLVGSCDLWDAAGESTRAKIGWHIASDYSGRGYATEAARRLLYIGFEINDVSRIYADCFAHNKAAMRVMEKIGMTRHRSNRLFSWRRALKYGENGSIVRYHVWRDQWLALNYGGGEVSNQPAA
jgi:[ribosomal protein S5]-alanine N-acetyltransferase